MNKYVISIVVTIFFVNLPCQVMLGPCEAEHQCDETKKSINHKN